MAKSQILFYPKKQRTTPHSLHTRPEQRTRHQRVEISAWKKKTVFLKNFNISYQTSWFSYNPPPLNVDLGDTSRDVNEARSGLVLAVGRVCSKKKKVEKKQHEKIHPAQNTPR